MGCRQVDHGQEVGRVFLEAGSNTAKLLELVESPLNHVSLPVDSLVEAIHVVSASLGWNHPLGTDFLDLIRELVTYVASIGDYMATSFVFDQRLSLRDIRYLPGREDKPQGQALGIAEQMDLRAQSTSGTPQSLVLFFFDPAACWCALTIVLSIMRYSFFASLTSTAKTFSHTPVAAQRVNRR